MDRCPTCRRVLGRSPKKAPTRVNGTTRAEDLAARKAARRAETAALREAVFERAGKWCELCQACSPREMHHLLGGSGRRTQQQSEQTVVAACVWCHWKWHQWGAKGFVVQVKAWAARHGYPLPASITKVA